MLELPGVVGIGQAGGVRRFVFAHGLFPAWHGRAAHAAPRRLARASLLVPNFNLPWGGLFLLTGYFSLRTCDTSAGASGFASSSHVVFCGVVFV